MPTSTRSSRKASQVAASAHPTHRHSDEPIAESKRYLKLRALASEKIFPTLENLAEEKGLDIEEHHEIPAQPESHDLAPSAWEGKLPEIVKKDIVFTQADTIIINEPADHINSVGKHANEESDAIPTQTEGRELAPAAWKTDELVSHEDEGATKEVDEKEFNRVDHPIEAATALSEHEHSGRNKKKNRKNRQSAPIQEDEISKPSEIAPLSSEEPIAESKANLKPQALASEQIFPTLEGLAEEKGLDIEEHHEIPAQPESHDLAPSAWEGKLPEIVKKDAEFTQADTIIINEPIAEINNQENHKKDGPADLEAALPLESNQTLEKDNGVDANEPIEASGRNKKKNRKNRQSAPIQENPIDDNSAGLNDNQKLAVYEEIQIDHAEKPSEIAPVSSEEPIAESKANLKPKALASEQIFPTLEGLAEEKGLDTYIDEHDNIPTQPESHDHAAWQGKLPKIVKQKYEFTQADTIIINELGERHTMNEEPAKEVQPAEELVQDEPEAYEEIQPSASKKKKAKKHRHQAPAEKAPVQDEGFEEDEELENPIEDEEPSAESKENLKPQALTSTEIFPTLKSLAEEKGIDSYLEERPWAGKLPEIVKQDAEFTQADTIIVDEPAERAAALAKKKQERKERRLQKQKLHQAEQEEEAPIEKEEKELAPSAWPQESQELEKQDGEYMDENQKPAAEKKASEEAELPLPFEAYFRQGTASPQADDKSDEMQLEAPAPLPSIIPAADQLNFAIKTISAEIQQREPFIEGLIVSSASGILGLYFSMVGGVLRLVGLRQISGRLIMGSRSLANSVIDNTPLHRFKVLGQRYKIYRIAARMAGKVDHNVRAQISNEPKSKSVQSLSAPASPESKHAENTRFDSFERFIVGCASSILVMYLSIVAGFLRLFGLRDLSGRLIMGFRSTADNVIEATPLRRVKVFGRKFGAYRMAARVARNVDREVRTQIGSMPAKKEVHFDGENNKKFL